jgi:hypothetical protein
VAPRAGRHRPCARPRQRGCRRRGGGAFRSVLAMARAWGRGTATCQAAGFAGGIEVDHHDLRRAPDAEGQRRVAEAARHDHLFATFGEGPIGIPRAVSRRHDQRAAEGHDLTAMGMARHGQVDAVAEVREDIRLMGHQKREVRTGRVSPSPRERRPPPGPGAVAQLEGALGFQTGQLKRGSVCHLHAQDVIAEHGNPAASKARCQIVGSASPGSWCWVVAPVVVSEDGEDTKRRTERWSASVTSSGDRLRPPMT